MYAPDGFVVAAAGTEAHGGIAGFVIRFHKNTLVFLPVERQRDIGTALFYRFPLFMRADTCLFRILP